MPLAACLSVLKPTTPSTLPLLDAELGFVEAFVDSAVGEEFGVGAFFGDAAFVDGFALRTLTKTSKTLSAVPIPEVRHLVGHCLATREMLARLGYGTHTRYQGKRGLPLPPRAPCGLPAGH